jgi:hypothetical protein
MPQDTNSSYLIKICRISGLIFCLTIISGGIRSQTSKSDPVDIQGWTIVSLGLNLPKKWEAGLTGQWRTENNMSSTKGFYLTPEISYGIHKKVKVFANFRYADVIGSHSSRVGIGLEYSTKISGFQIGLRPQFQYTLKYADDGDGSATGTSILRTRLSVRHRITKKIDGYLQFEPYFTFSPGEYFIDNIRNTVGLRYEYKKDRRISVFYIYRPDFAKSYNRLFHVAGIRWDVDLKWKK